MEFFIGICSTIVGEIAKVTVVPVGRQLGYLFYYQRNINDLSKQIEDLNVKKTSLDRRVVEARRSGEKIEEIVGNWQNEVEQCFKDAEDILKPECHREAKCSYSRSFPNLVTRRKLSRKAKKMVEVIASKIEKVGTFKSISYTPPLQSSFENNGFEGFSTRMLALKKIMEALKDLNFRRIGVHGSGGVGKTTLVKEVARKSQQEGLFSEVVMVTVSQSSDLQNIQREIARKLGLKVSPDEIKTVLADLLQQRLKDEKKLLIILDDLWERLELEDAGIYFNKDGQEGCKILLVSRNRYVLRNDMGVEKDIMVELLSESEAMNLFKKVVGGKCEETNFKDLVIEIVEKCGGLPVAIKPIARALKDRDITAWRTALRKLKSSPKDGYIEAYPCIKTSYDFLKDDEKMILLLCAQHREDENISVEDLMNIYAASCGLFLEVDTLQDARDLVQTLVDNLKGYNLLLGGDKDGSVKLHDVTREIMVSIAMEYDSMYCYENSRSLNSALVNEKLKHDAIGISLLGCNFNQFPDGLPCSKLKLLIMHQGIYKRSDFRPIPFPKEFLEKAKELRALCIRSIIVQTLPLSLCSLQNLQTLSLQHCVLEDMDFIGELKNLVVLDLSHSEFKRLPQQIGKLTCLRQLNLNQCIDLKEIQPKVISSLVKLEELYMDNIEDAGVLPKDMFVDGKLKRFNIIVGGNRRAYRGNGCDYELETSSRRLYLDLEESSHLYEPVFQMLMKESEVLYLRTLSGVTCGLPFLKEKVAFLDRHPASLSTWNLTKLNVSSCVNLKHAFVSAFIGSMTQLKDLKITECPDMEEVIAVEEGTNSQVILFPKLTSLKLEDLKSLKTFCGGDYKIKFESLLELVIAECPKPKTFTSNSMPTTSTRSAEEKIEQPLINNKVVFFNIKLSGITFRNLQELTVWECNNLQYLLPYEMVESLKHLKQLTIWLCKDMEQIIAKEEDGRLKNISFPKLESIDLVGLPKLKRVCQGDRVECPSLLKLYIHRCPEFRTFIPNSASMKETEFGAQQSLFNDKVAFFNIMLFGITFRDLQELTIYKCGNSQYLLPFEIVKSLEQLKKLYVGGCVGMEQIITKEEDGRLKNISFPKLESIGLTNLPKLKRFCEGDRVECPSLLKLKIWECPKFRTFIPNSTLVEGTELVAQQPLFNDKVVLTNLEELTVYDWWEDVNEIWPRQSSTFLFPNLKVLYLAQPRSSGFSLSEILRFKDVESISLWGCLEEKIWQDEEHGQTLTYLRNLETLDIHKCDRLKTLLMSSSFSFENLTELQVSKCHGLVNLFDSSIAKTLVQLNTVSIAECDQLIQVITEDVNKVEDELADSKIVFKQLKSLTLQLLPSLKSFYGGKDELEFPKLEKLVVEKCPKMRTFSHGMSISSPNLKTIKTAYDTGEDTGYDEEDLNNSMLSASTRSVAEKIEQPLIYKKVGSFNIMLSGITFRDLQKLTIQNCNNLQYLLPFETVESLKHLKMLYVWDCVGMEQIITKEEDGRLKDISFPKLEFIDLVHLPKLSRFCEGDHVECPSLLKLEIRGCPEFRTFIPNSTSVEGTELVAQQALFNDKVAFFNIMLSGITFRDLRELTIWNCDNLQYLLSFETVKSLKHLQKLSVWGCVSMEQIITKAEDGRFKNISFPKLKSIDLGDLPKLKRFCEGNRVECPSILKLRIWQCPEFRTIISNSVSVEETEFVAQQPLFNDKVVLTNLEELSLSDWWEDVNEMWPRQSSTVLFPNLKALDLTQGRSSGFRFKKLESISLCGYLEEKIWQDEHGRTLTYLRNLVLYKLPKLMHLFEDPVAENIQFVISETVRNLETLVIYECNRLKTLVMSSSLSFKNLTELHVIECHGLVNLFDSLIAKTLVQLKAMSISKCNRLIRAITEDVNKMKDELAETEIVFNQLESLTLELLPTLKSFYGGKNKLEFPKLEKLSVRKCPEIRTFSCGMSISSPNLKTIDTGSDTEEDLKGDLNASIGKLWEKSRMTH